MFRPSAMTRVPGSLLFGVNVLWIPLAFLFDGVTVLVLPVRLGSDATAIGLTSFAGLAVGALLQPLVGWLSDRSRDRIDRRVVASLAAMIALVGLWALAGSSGMLAAVIAYIVLQAAAAAVQAVQQTFIPEHVQPGRRGRASGVKSAFDVGGSFLAFAILGGLLAAGELRAAALATTVVFVLGLILMWLAVPRIAAPAVSQRRGGRALPEAFRSLVVARLLFLIGTYAVGRFLVLLVGQRLGIATDRAADEAGGLLALLTLATAAAAVPAGWLADRWARRDLMLAGALVAAVGVLALIPAAGMVGLMAGGLVMAVGTALFVTANWAATTALVPAESAGRLMGIASLGTAFAAAVAGLVGPIVDAGGFGPALLLAAGCCAAAIVPLLLPTAHAHTARSSA